ncbi:MAG: N-acetylglucosamine-6-phosphate deacetylase [Lachnospiraceae bacterium]|jgi:N-acetylglucosamine-6-phosphate deacetylase|nr:N-acetylglucosamine-6-phosphate deacetylase [Lachnospiraceae bacterium]
MIVKNGLVYQKGEFRKQDVEIRDGKFIKISSAISGDEEINIRGFRMAPGFFEIHTHGAVGVDINGATAEGLEKISCFLAKQGVTNWLCSILTDTKEQTLRCIQEYKRWKTLEHWGADLCGIHLEGPFLSEEYAGAMPKSLLLDMDLELIRRYQEEAEGDIRYITVSPERKGVIEAITAIRSMGIQVAMGHSGAGYEEAVTAIKQGVGACTHTFNAMRLFHQHEPAIMGAALESDIYCEAICDGLHLHPGSVRLLLKTKGNKRVVAITDSIMATGFPEGNYKLGVNDVVVKNGDARLASDGTRAGSVLTAKRAFHNFLDFTGYPAEEILPLFTENPARLLGMERKTGMIEEKRDANFLLLDDKNNIKAVYVKGRSV